MRSSRSPFPVDPATIAKAYGLHIHMFTLTGVNGILVNVQGVWSIGISKWLPFTRRRFTFAHEIAHYELHRDLQQSFDCRPGVTSRLEQEANRRAAEILMPEDLVAPWVLSLKPSEAAASHFGVSQVAWEKRMLQLCRETQLGRELEVALAKRVHEVARVAPPSAPKEEPAIRIQVSRKRWGRVVYTYL